MSEDENRGLCGKLDEDCDWSGDPSDTKTIDKDGKKIEVKCMDCDIGKQSIAVAQLEKSWEEDEDYSDDEESEDEDNEDLEDEDD